MGRAGSAARRASRGALDERDRQHVAQRLVVGACDPQDEPLHGTLAALGERLPDRREADEVGRLDVVIADEREIPRDLQPEPAGGLEDTDRLGVAGRDDGRRAARLAEHRVGGRTRLGPAVLGDA